jgi:hypothetical protein
VWKSYLTTGWCQLEGRTAAGYPRCRALRSEQRNAAKTWSNRLMLTVLHSVGL